MGPKVKKIPVHAPTLGEAEIEAVVRCLAIDRFAGNEPVIEFEQALAAAIGAKRAIAVANGTVALHLAMLACGIGPGDEVIVPSLTFVASANAIAYVGATPVFADVDPVTWQMTAGGAAALITPRTRAIVAVHLYGRPCDANGLHHLARRHGLYLIEDCAEALGTTIGGRHVGLSADIATFSFYKNKTITTGEGGAIITDRNDLHERIVLLKGQGVPLGRRYWHEIVGYNYRMTNLSAALGCAQLGRLSAICASKRRIASHYQAALAGLPISIQSDAEFAESAPWLVAATVISHEVRDQLVAALSARDIETRPVFEPIIRFPMYSDANASTPIAERISSTGICIPSSPDLSDEDLNRVTRGITSFFG